MSGNYVINIGRQLGSGGKEIERSWQPVWESTSTTRN